MVKKAGKPKPKRRSARKAPKPRKRAKAANARRTAKTRSAAIIERDRRVISTSYTRGHPLVVERGSGAAIWDIDGKEYLPTRVISRGEKSSEYMVDFCQPPGISEAEFKQQRASLRKELDNIKSHFEPK